MTPYTLFYPLGLMNLLDRFAFYGTRVMLVLYFVSEFGVSSEYAYEFYGAILALIYASPIVGGWLIDRGFDRTLAVFSGLFFKVVGHTWLIFADSMIGLMVAFTSIIIGHMFYKPSVLTLFSDFSYHLKQPKDKSFTILFVCFQLGAILGILLCGFIAERYGWRLGMGLAALVLLVQFILFLIQYKKLDILLDQVSSILVRGSHLLVLLLLSVATALLLYYPMILDGLFPILMIGIIFYIMKIIGRLSASQKKSIIQLCFILGVTVVYLAFYEQKAVSFNLYIKHYLNRNFFDFLIPATWFQMFPSIFMVIFAFGGVWFWGQMKKKGREIVGYDKYILGIVFMLIAHLILFFGLKYQTSNMLMMFLLSYVFIGIAESIIFPIVMASTSTYAPKEHKNFFMGLMAFSGSIAHYLASEIAKISSAPEKGGQLINLEGFEHLLFIMAGGFIVLIGVMVIFRKFFIRKSPYL